MFEPIAPPASKATEAHRRYQDLLDGTFEIPKGVTGFCFQDGSMLEFTMEDGWHVSQRVLEVK